MQILRFHPLKATDGLLEMVNLISTGCRYHLRLRHYWSLYYVDVLKTAQPVTVDAKEMAYPVQNYASAASNETILTTTCGRKVLRTVKARKNVRLGEKSTS